MRAVDLIRKKRDGGELSREEIEFLISGATHERVPDYQMAAFLMAVVWRGMTRAELAALTESMLNSGSVLDWSDLPAAKVDKHSTGGVGDKTSLILAPIVAAAGLYVPMISGRGLGHTGGTLDKLESIPGFNVHLEMGAFRRVLALSRCALIGQTPEIAPADKKLYALRDVTATVESPYLITASIMSKKMAEGIDALVLDVKTGSGAFLRKREDAEYLAALMVATAEAAGTRTVALMTDMGQPLGAMAGNWIELMESVELLSGKRPAESEDLRELSLILAGWMIFLGGQAISPEDGFLRADAAMADGSGLTVFMEMIEAQGGDSSVFENMPGFHKPGATLIVEAWESGYIASMDTTTLGWAVQRLGAGREKAGEPVDPHAGIYFHARRGAFVEKGQPLATLYATTDALLAEPVSLLKQAIVFSDVAPEPVELVSLVFTRADSESYLRDAVR